MSCGTAITLHEPVEKLPGLRRITPPTIPMPIARSFCGDSVSFSTPTVAASTKSGEVSMIAAESDEEAILLATSMDQSFVRMRTGGTGKLGPPIPGFRDTLDPQAIAMIDSMRVVSAIGGPATVRESIQRFIERTQADELIIGGSIWDPAARRRSLQIAMQATR